MLMYFSDFELLFFFFKLSGGLSEWTLVPNLGPNQNAACRHRPENEL